jgi:hypothetical protein
MQSFGSGSGSGLLWERRYSLGDRGMLTLWDGDLGCTRSRGVVIPGSGMLVFDASRN